MEHSMKAGSIHANMHSLHLVLFLPPSHDALRTSDERASDLRAGQKWGVGERGGTSGVQEASDSPCERGLFRCNTFDPQRVRSPQRRSEFSVWDRLEDAESVFLGLLADCSLPFLPRAYNPGLECLVLEDVPPSSSGSGSADIEAGIAAAVKAYACEIVARCEIIPTFAADGVGSWDDGRRGDACRRSAVPEFRDGFKRQWLVKSPIFVRLCSAIPAFTRLVVPPGVALKTKTEMFAAPTTAILAEWQPAKIPNFHGFWGVHMSVHNAMAGTDMRLAEQVPASDYLSAMMESPPHVHEVRSSWGNRYTGGSKDNPYLQQQRFHTYNETIHPQVGSSYQRLGSCMSVL
eukprot:2160332-Rhodomonas_salina.3